MPSGRGRSTTAAATFATLLTASSAPIETNRWRQRRAITRTARLAHQISKTDGYLTSYPTAHMTLMSVGVRNRLLQDSTR